MLSRSAVLTLSMRCSAQRAPNRISAQRKRQARHLLPPLAQVDDAVQPCLRVGELAFVDDQSGFVFALEHLRE